MKLNGKRRRNIPCGLVFMDPEGRTWLHLMVRLHLISRIGVMDQVRGGEHLGCEELNIRRAVVKPRVHIFGHIHDGYGVAFAGSRVLVNASICDEDYRAINRPIVVDISPEKVEVLGMGPRPRKERLAALTAILDAAEHAPEEIQGLQVQAVLQGLAKLRGIPPEDLCHDYVKRGLRSDLVRFTRSEGKPSRRPLPVKILDGYEDEDQTPTLEKLP